MKNKDCINCAEYQRCRESRVSIIFFIVGIVATIAVRAVMILIHVKPVYGQIAWYVGITGFLFFFVYKFKVDQERSKIITRNRLVDKVSRGDTITEDDRRLISSILCALSSKKDRINYFLIFVSSAIAIVVALYFDLSK